MARLLFPHVRRTPPRASRTDAHRAGDPRGIRTRLHPDSPRCSSLAYLPGTRRSSRLASRVLPRPRCTRGPRHGALVARLVAFGDAHLGRMHLVHLRDEQGRNIREEDFLRSFDWAIDATIELEPDGFLWLGDI